MEDLGQENSGASREGKDRLGRKLKEKYTQFKKDRRNAETQWLKNLNQFLGKYDSDIAQNLDANTSRAYPKVTRIKCVSMKARLMSLLFPAGEKNWGIDSSPTPSLPQDTLIRLLGDWRAENPGAQPTQETIDTLVDRAAKDIAQRMEKVIDDQLKDIDPYASRDYETLVGKVVFSGVLYGPGVIKGPMTITERTSRYVLDVQGVPQLVEADTYRPYFDFVSAWNYYPDMSAANFDGMDGEFERHVYTRHQALQLANRPDFDGDAIRRYLDTYPDGNYTKYEFENELQALGGQNANVVARGGKYEFVEYWGSAPLNELKAAGMVMPEDDQEQAQDETGDVRFTAWVLDDVVVKVAINPFREGTKVYHQFIFEEDEVNLLGSGLPPIMRDSQLAVSSFARMLIDNASIVCAPQAEVDLDLLSPTQTDMSIKPRKVWLKEGGTATQRAVHSISFDSHIGELSAAMKLFREYADSETFINPLTGGDLEGVPGEALRTTGGASMAYANAALPFRDIVRNFDQFTVSVIDALAQWNSIFHVDRDRLSGDIRPIPRGANSLMAKELRAFALDNLANTLTEEERMYINEEELLKQRLMVRDLPLSQLLATPEQVEQRRAERAQQLQQSQQQAALMFDAQLRNLGSDTLKQLAQAQKNMDTGDATVFKALVDAIQKGATPDELASIAARISEGRRGVQGQPDNSSPGGVAQG